MGFLNDLLSGIADSFDPIGLFHEGSSGANGHSTSLSDLWDQIINGNANNYNYETAQKNLEYQKERNEIEDARYEEETAYNREFAEEERDYQRQFAEEERDYNREMAEDERAYQRELDEYNKAFAEEDRDYQRQFNEEERDYQRALQQQIFEREDTAIQRQGSQLSSMGINPLSQQMNGLGSGAVVSASSPTTASAPSFGSSGSASSTAGRGSAPGMSGRGGSALHNDFKMLPNGVMSLISPLMSFADTFNGLQTGEYQRDALALQNDAQFLQNLKTANSLGIKYSGYLPYETGGKNYRKNIYTFKDENGKPLFESDLFKQSLGSGFRKQYLDSVPDWVGSLSMASDDSVYKNVEKAITKASDMVDNVTDKLMNNSIFDIGEKNGKFSIGKFFLSLFGL